MQTWPSHLMPSLGSGTMPQPQVPRPLVAIHIAMCVSIFSAFGVSVQFGTLQIYSPDPPVHWRKCSNQYKNICNGRYTSC